MLFLLKQKSKPLVAPKARKTYDLGGTLDDYVRTMDEFAEKENQSNIDSQSQQESN